MANFRDVLPPPPWEGPPIPRGWLQGEPPTPAQLRYIAILCQKLSIKEPLEERVRTRGEAGRLIRELEAEAKYRKRSGNPKFIYRAAPERLRPPGWQPRKPYPEEMRYTLTPEQEQYLISEVRKAYRARPGPTQHFVELARRYAEADLWVKISDEMAREIARKAMMF